MLTFTLTGIIVRSIRNIFLTAAFISTTSPAVTQLGWVQVPSPDPSATRNMIRGISGTSSSDVWAVGSYEELFNYNPYNVQHDLLLHWNGNAWQQFPALNLSTTLNDLWDVEAISANNVWAVGAYNDFATTRAELLHYDGVSWKNQPLPLITGGSFLNALHAFSASDIWAAGSQAGSPTRPCYVIHYNGSSWTEIPVPSVGVYRNRFNDIHGISSNDIWAAGHWGDSYGDFHALIMHWNGTNWSNISLPSSIVTQSSEVLSIKMIASNDVWAVGYYSSGGMFKIHWDGNNWTEILPANGGGGAFAALSSNNVFSVGGEISRWNGSAWTVVDGLTHLSYPSLGSAVVFSNGEIWAGGRTADISNSFFSLIYRSVNHIPVFTEGTAQTWNIAAGSNNNSADELLLTTDADISQVLTYSVVTAPMHGVLNGLPATAITNNGSAIPTGITYTPAPGYTGTDQFVIKVAAGQVNAETTVNVHVLGPLPVTLADFKVTRENNNISLKWTTTSESNTLKFEIEHSADGVRFVNIGAIPAQGNSSIPHSYSFIHSSPVPGRNFYRLRLVDLDGRTEVFSGQYNFDVAILQPIVILSNPVRNSKLDLRINAKGTYQLNIYNGQGQKILSKNVENTAAGSRSPIDLPYSIRGIYFLELVNSTQQYTVKFLVQ